MKRKTILISAIIATIMVVSLVSFNLWTSDSKKSHSNSSSLVYRVGSFDLNTTIVNGSINKITKLDDRNSILVEMGSFNQGYLIIQTPKILFKALNDDYDNLFFIILLDNEETSYEQVDPETIKIVFPNDSKEIEIVGTSKLN